MQMTNIYIGLGIFAVCVIVLMVLMRKIMQKKLRSTIASIKNHMEEHGHKVVLQPVSCTSYGYESNTLDGQTNGLIVMTDKSFLFHPLSKKGEIFEICRADRMRVGVETKFEGVEVNLSRGKFFVIQPDPELKIGFLMKDADGYKSRVEETLAAA